MSQHEPQAHPLDTVLQERITARLRSEASPCPDALWDELKTDLEQRGRTESRSRASRLYRLLPYAAGLLLMFGLLYWQRGTTPVQAMEIVVDIPRDVAVFKASSALSGSRQEVQAGLEAAGYRVHIGDIESYNGSHGHYVELHGMDHVTIDGKPCPCLRLNFTCCGQPVISYVVKADDKQAVTFKSDQEHVKQAEKLAEGYRIVTFSPHPTEPVESLVAGE
ncbi:hypothetical protein ACFL6U_08475 [Planctomycetota bacterium]